MSIDQGYELCEADKFVQQETREATEYGREANRHRTASIAGRTAVQEAFQNRLQQLHQHEACPSPEQEA